MKLRQLLIGYHNSAPIVQPIDAELSIGQFVCLVGRNGSGKSTLLRTLAGLQPALGGYIEGGLQQQVAIVLTQMPQLSNTTVLEMVASGRLAYTGLFGRLSPQDIQMAHQAIKLMHIEHLASRNFTTLSDGEKQKTMIARALTQERPFLLLDEPSAFLDHPSKVELMQTLHTLAHEGQKGILLSTHDLELALRFADAFWELCPHNEQSQLQDPQVPRLLLRTT